MPQKRDIAVTRFHEGARLFQHGLHHAAALAAAHIRDDTVAAKVVAAVHHGQKRLEAAISHNGKPLCDAARLIRQLEHAVPTAEGPV